MACLFRPGVHWGALWRSCRLHMARYDGLLAGEEVLDEVGARVRHDEELAQSGELREQHRVDLSDQGAASQQPKDGG